MLHHSSFVLRNLRKPHLAQTTLATTELYLLRRVIQAIIGAGVIAVPLALLTWVDHLRKSFIEARDRLEKKDQQRAALQQPAALGAPELPFDFHVSPSTHSRSRPVLGTLLKNPPRPRSRSLSPSRLSTDAPDPLVNDLIAPRRRRSVTKRQALDPSASSTAQLGSTSSAPSTVVGTPEP